MQLKVDTLGHNTLADLGSLPKHRRDWLEVFGNQWGPRRFERQPLSADERAALEAATNPFRGK